MRIFSRRHVLGWAAAGLTTFSSARLPALPAATVRFTVARRGNPARGGRDIVLIPGLASGPDIWNGLAGSLAGNRLHLIHVAGFAGLPAGSNARGALLNPIADELSRYIAASRMQRPALIGHSMGGTLALTTALRMAGRIDRLMVVDMLPEGSAMLGGTAQGMGYLAQQLNGYFGGTKAGRQILADMVRKTPGAEGSDPAVIAQALTELAETDLTPQLPRLSCPLTVAHALSGDAQTQAAQSRRYRAAYAGARQAHIVGIGPSGHMVMLDQPQKFMAAARAFLR